MILEMHHLFFNKVSFKLGALFPASDELPHAVSEEFQAPVLDPHLNCALDLILRLQMNTFDISLRKEMKVARR